MRVIEPIVTLSVFVVSLVIAMRGYSVEEQPKVGRRFPPRHHARELFTADFKPTSEQAQLFARLDAIDLTGFHVANLRPAQIIAAIRTLLWAKGSSAITIRIDPALESCQTGVTYTKDEMPLVNAMFYLTELAGVRYELRGAEIVALPPDHSGNEPAKTNSEMKPAFLAFCVVTCALAGWHFGSNQRFAADRPVAPTSHRPISGPPERHAGCSTAFAYAAVASRSAFTRLWALRTYCPSHDILDPSVCPH